MSQDLLSPIQEFKCRGKMVVESNELDVEFLIKQMGNGRLVGELETTAPWRTLNKIFESHKRFRLIGSDENHLAVNVDHCYLTSLSGCTKTLAGFNAFEALTRPERLSGKPKEKLVVVFALLNVDKTFQVELDTPLGILYLRPIKGHEEKLRLIKILEISGVTAFAEIFINNPFVLGSFDEILSKSVDVVQGFLYIAELADTCYHSWCSASIYEKMENSDKYELVLQKMQRPKMKPPSYRGITNPAHSSYFFESAYEGYRGREKELKDLYDFDIALEWYLEANMATVLESQYLMACTCLELLVDRFEEKTRTGFIMDQNMFRDDLYRVLVSRARQHMKELGLSSDQRKEIYMKLRGLNRRSVRTGIESLLTNLKVMYNDLFDDIGTIINIRNKITHSGTYANIDELSEVFNKLYVLLTRVFLSILNYRRDYFDWVKGAWVDFKDVCG